MRTFIQWGSLAAFASLSVAIPGPIVMGCNHDNVLRAFLDRNRYEEAIKFCSAYVEVTPGSGLITSTVNATMTSIVFETTSTTKTSYALATTTATKTLLCPATPTGPTSTTICGIDAYTTQDNVISANPVNFPEDCKQLCLSEQACQSFQIQNIQQGLYYFCKLYTTSIDRNIVTEAPGGEFTLWDRNCFELSPTGCSALPTSNPSPAISNAPVTPTTIPVPLEELCPPPVNANLFCGTPSYTFEETDVISRFNAAPLDCHIACLWDIECFSIQIYVGSIYCQLNRVGVDGNIPPNMGGAISYDRNCPQYLPDVCLETEPSPTESPTPEVTPTPESTPTPEPTPTCNPTPATSRTCHLEGQQPQNTGLIEGTYVESFETCQGLCIVEMSCRSFSVAITSISKYCLLWSTDLSNVQAEPGSGTFFSDNNCESEESIAPNGLLPCTTPIPETTPTQTPEITSSPTPETTLTAEETPSCTPSPPTSRTCHLEGLRRQNTGVVDNTFAEFVTCRVYCSEIDECRSFSHTPANNNCQLWSLDPVAGVQVEPGSGTFFYDRNCEKAEPVAPDPGALLPCTTPAAVIPKRQVSVPTFIPATVPASRVSSACDCFLRFPNNSPQANAVLTTQTIFENTTITSTTIVDATQIDTLTLTTTAYNTAAP